MKIAIIPARSGSKGLPNKNIKELCDMPLLAHSIKCAEQSELFNEIFVSTDSQHYADIALQYGGSVPFLRDEALAGDTVSMWDVVREDLLKYEAIGKTFDSITLLQPTSPLRTPDDIIAVHRIYQERQADTVVALCKTDYAPGVCNTLPENNSLNEFISSNLQNKQRQELPDYYRINGAIYLMSCAYLSQTTNIYGTDSYAYIMPKERSIDIDDEWDFLMAEAIMEYVKSKKAVL